MNKTLRYALGVVLTAGFVLPVLAQDNFPDVPDNHWAYEALATMKKEGLLVGYPDGLFRGPRPASRYELAVAVHATYEHLKNITDGLQKQIDDLKAAQGNSGDLQAIKDQLAQLQNDVNNMKGWGADIDNLKKMAAEFEKELASMGVDIEQMKKDLADLARRVGVLEAHRLPVDIHGDFNLMMYGGISSNHEPGITYDGRLVGVDHLQDAPGILKLNGLTRDLSIFHELGLRLSSNNDTGPKWHATVAIGNMMGTSSSSYNGNFSSPFSQGSTFGGRAIGEADESVYFQDFAVDFDTSLLGQNFSAELGRTGYSIDPYIFQRPDTTPYFENSRWDDGKWYFDGGILGFHWGGIRFDTIAGRNSDRTSTNGTELNPMTVGQVSATPFHIGLPSNGMSTDALLGFNLNIPLSTQGKLDLAYLLFENEAEQNNVNGADHADVFGGDLKWNFGQINFDGGYSQSNLRVSNHNVVNKDNYAWHAEASYDAARWGLSVGYREIQPLFGAPGDWGRLGVTWNPTDIRGPWAAVHFNITDALKLKVSGEFDSGVGRAGVSALQTNDHINSYKAELGYRINPAWNLTLGGEWVDIDLHNLSGGHPQERWYNIGLGYNMSDMAKLSFLWQISDFDLKGAASFFNGGAGGFSSFSGGGDTSRLRGSLIATQLSIKF